MIATPVALLVCGTWVMCSEPRMPAFFPSDLNLTVPGVSLLVSEGISSFQKSGLPTRNGNTITRPKAANPRTIRIGPYVPPLPIPSYWIKTK